MIKKANYRKKNYFISDTMEYCSRQCIRRTLYAVIIGISPIIICLLLIAITRLIIHCLEMSYNRRQKPIDHRRSLSMFYQSSRPTISYTPVSVTELQRIIRGEYQSQQQSESSSSYVTNDRNSPKSSHFIKSILTRRESSSPPPSSSLSSNTLANLVIRRNAIGTTPLTALFAPILTSPTSLTVDTINEQNTRRPSIMTVKHESIETTTLSAINNNNDNDNSTIFYNTSDSLDIELTENDPLVTLPKTMSTTTTTTTVVVEEFLDFHSVHSIPYSLNLVNSILENDF